MKMAILSKILVTLLLLPALAGCGRVGLGLRPGMIYDNSVGPLTARRPNFRAGEVGIVIPPNLKEKKTTAHQISANIPGVLFPGAGTLLTVGWGDVSKARALQEGELPEVVYADARTISILGIYQKTIISWYADASIPYEGPVWRASDR